MDELNSYNQSRWNALAEAGIQYSQPWLELDAQKARAYLQQHRAPSEVAGWQVLCLASGGGQQTAVFSLLKANVTIFDFSEAQLAQDQKAANHYGYTLQIEQGDMRDLSRFDSQQFDMVYHPYSVNFIPKVRPVFAQVARILKPNGFYWLQTANPFVMGIEYESWNGEGYLLKKKYEGGQILFDEGDEWDIGGQIVQGPHEFRHTYNDLLRIPLELGFTLQDTWEEQDNTPDPTNGSWAHYMQCAPAFLYFLWRR